MIESILASGIFELIKESVQPVLRGLRRSDFVQVEDRLLVKLDKKYKRYDIDKTRLRFFFKREIVQKELDEFRETFKYPDLNIIESEFRAEFSTDFDPRLLDGLAKDFTRDFIGSLISSFPYQTGLLLKRVDESDEENTAQHAKTHQELSGLKTQFEKLIKQSTQPKRTIKETEQLPKMQVETPAEMESVSLVPYVRTIEYLERDLRKHKNAIEKQIKRGLDEVVELIRNYQLKQALIRLESLRDQELADIPNLNEIDAALRAGVYRLLGICQMRLGDLETASENFDTAKTIVGETEKLNRALLEYHTLKRDYESASQLAHEILTENPDLIEAKNALALIQLNEKKFEDVIRFYEGEPQADQDPTAQDILAIAHLQLKNLPEALEKAQKLAELEPQAPRAYEALGNVYLTKAYAPLQDQGQLYADWFREVVDKEPLYQAISNYQTSLELYETWS